MNYRKTLVMTLLNKALLIIPTIILFVPTQAEAYRDSCKKFPDHIPYVYNGGHSGYEYPMQEAIASFESTTVIDFIQVGGYGTQDQQNLLSEDYGDIGWVGLADTYSGGTACIATHSDNRVNMYYGAGYGIGYENIRKVAVHELGHSHGFGHVTDVNSPMHGNPFVTAYIYTGAEQTELNELYCPSCQTVALQYLPNGLHVAANGSLVADRPWIGEWEIFKLHDRGGGWFALQNYQGMWVRAYNNGGDDVTAVSPWIGEWETFQAIPSYGGYSLRTSSGYDSTGAYWYPQISAHATFASTYTTFFPVWNP